MVKKTLVSAVILSLLCLILTLLPANASPGGYAQPTATERPTVFPPTPRPSVLPPPRPTFTPSPTVSPTPTRNVPPLTPTPPSELPVVPEPSTLLLLGSAASGLAAYIGLQIRAHRRR